MADKKEIGKLDLIMQDPKFIELSVKVMEMEADIDEDYLIPFEPDEVDEDTDAPIVKTRRGDYGNDIQYIPVKYIRKRLDKAFKQKWSFFIVAERREDEPFQRWSKKDDDFIDGDNYLRCVGMMIVPGLGIRMEYGVKKVFGSGEATDWKACKTDAFKKCAEAFGIYLNYSDDDEEDESSNTSNGGKKKKNKVDLSDVEYSDEELEDAFETEIGFGKYKGATLKEIVDEEDDIKYVEWLSENANEDEIRDMALIVLKYYEEQEEEKSNRRSRRNNAKSYNSGKSKNKKSSKSKSRKDDDEDEDEEEEEEKSSKKKNKSKNKKSSKSKSRKDDDEDEEMEELLEACRTELDDYDKVQAKSIISSISISNKYPKGKTKLDQLTLDELRELADILEV